jgi:hypothetical protein
MSTEVAAVTGEDFAGTASHEENAIHAKLTGNADFAALDAVEMLLRRTHSEARRLGVREVVVDLKQLEFMNSSCFKCFVSWIADIQELAEPAQYKVKFVSNPQLHWQKRSLHSLRCFAVELITIAEA